MIDFRNRLSVLGLVAVLAVAIMATACSPEPGTAGSPSDTKASAGEVFGQDQVGPAVDGVVHKTIKELPVKRLAEGLVPPTNRWFSGLVFGDKPQPVFPLPLSFGLTDSGFAFGQPVVTTTEKNISGGFRPDVSRRCRRRERSGQRVRHADRDRRLPGRRRKGARSYPDRGRVRPSSAIPRRRAARSPAPFSSSRPAMHGPPRQAEVTYGLVVNGGQVSGGTVKLDKGGTATWFVVPQDGSVDKLAQFAAHPVTGSGLDYRLDGDHVQTTLTYEADGDTAVCRDAPSAAKPGVRHDVRPRQLSEHLRHDDSCALAPNCPGARPCPSPRPHSISERSALRSVRSSAAQVKKDAAALPAFPADSYFGGKAIYRAAMLYQLALQLDAERARRRTQSQADRVARSVDRSARLCQTPGVLLRLRRAGQGCRRHDAVVRLGGVQRPPLPLRLFLVRRRRACGKRSGPRQAVCASHEPARGGHRVVG